MKQFKIITLIGSAGQTRFYVRHRVRLFGINLWWSGMWIFENGMADYTLMTTSMAHAHELIDTLRKDYAVKTQTWQKIETRV